MVTQPLRLRLAALQGDGRLPLAPSPLGRSHDLNGTHSEGAAGIRDLGFAWDEEREIFVLRDAIPLSELGLSPAAFEFSRLGAVSPAVPPEGGRLLLFDLETTGLQRGAGTVPFLYGWGWLEGSRLQLEQWLLPQLGAEEALVEAAIHQLKAAELLVTYNGGSYDLPLLRSRMVMSGVDRPWPATPHLDLLPVVRRLFRHRLERCTLRSAEVELLHLRREGDLPGREAPERFWQFLRDGDAAPLAAVVRHNREDVVSLLRLLDHVVRHLGVDDPHPTDWLSLGRFAEARGRLEEAHARYRRAEELSPAPLDRAGALRGARLLRRQNRPTEACAAWTSIWERWRDPEAAEALCVDLEHRQGDPASALELAKLAFREAPVGWDQRFARRIWRLEGRVGGLPQRPEPGGDRPWAAWLPGGASYQAWLAVRGADRGRRERRLTAVG